MKKYIEILIANRITVLIGLAVLTITAISSVINLPVDTVPDITNVQVMVNVKTVGLDPERIEKSITRPVEISLQSLPHLEQMRSISKFGLSQTTLVFTENTDIYWARQQVGLKIQELQNELPAGSRVELAPASTGLGEVVMYTVRARAGSLLEKKSDVEKLTYLRTVQDFIIRPYLMANAKGIAEVDSGGGFQKQIHIDLKPNLLEQHGITIQDVANRIQSVGQNVGGGYIEENKKQIIVHTLGNISLQNLKNLPVKMNLFGGNILLSQIADVKIDHPQRVGGTTFQGQEAVLGTVLMRIGENSREVAERAEAALKKIILPDDAEIKIAYSRTFLVGATITTVVKNLAEGAALVIIILILLLGNFRAAIITAMTIPICMLFVLVGMDYFKVSASLMSLGALDFGLLVDGSIVVIENYLRILNKDGSKVQSPKARIAILVQCIKEVIKPVVIGLSIIMLVYIPILGFQGTEGKLYKPMAHVVLMGMASSLLVAIAIIPVFAYFTLKKGHEHEKEPVLFRLLQQILLPISNFALRHKIITVSTALIIFLFSLFGFFKLGAEFMPALNEGDMIINVTRHSDISLSQVIEDQKEVDKIIQQHKEVEVVFSRSGTNEAGTDPMALNFTDCFVILKKNLNLSTNEKRKLFERIKKQILEKFPNDDIAETQPIEMRFNEMLEGSRADISLRIYGKDLEKLYESQDKAVEILEKIKGIAEVELDALSSLKKSQVIQILYDYNALSRYNIDLSEVNSIIEAALVGKEVGEFYEGDWQFPIILRLNEDLQKSAADILKIPVPLKDGGTIPLGYVTRINSAPQVTSIARTNSSRYAGVAINLQDRDPQSFLVEAKQKLNLQTLGLTNDFNISWEGQFQNLAKAQIRLLITVPLILIIVFYLLYLSFRSVKQAVIIFSGIPLALSGGIAALLITGINFSIAAAVGFIALLGISVLNGLVLISFINELLADGQNILDAIQEAVRVRLRPVLMTAFVASLGFLPMALNSGIGAEVQKPLAIVVIGGIISSTFLTIVVLPALFRLFYREEK